MANTEYEYIKAILDWGSITEAAKNLYISQSALSQYLKRVEQRLGIEIFDRDLSPLRLTDAGEIFYASLEEIMEIEEETISQIEDLNNLRRGEVIVGATDYLSYYLLSGVIKKFNDKYPGIKIDLLEGKTSELDNAALSGNCDFSISYSASNLDELTNIKLYQEELFVAIPLANPIVKECNIEFPQYNKFPTIDAKLLNNNNIIRMKKGQNLRFIFQELDVLTNYSLKTILATDSMYLANKFVSEGVGITIIPKFMALDTNLNCVYVRIKPSLSKRRIMIHYNSTKRVRKPAQILMSMLKDYATENF